MSIAFWAQDRGASEVVRDHRVRNKVGCVDPLLGKLPAWYHVLAVQVALVEGVVEIHAQPGALVFGVIPIMEANILVPDMPSGVADVLFETAPPSFRHVYYQPQTLWSHRRRRCLCCRLRPVLFPDA